VVKSFPRKIPLVGTKFPPAVCKGLFQKDGKYEYLLGLLGLNYWMTYFWNLGRVKTGSRSRNQENVLGFSEYLAQNQKYLLQFKLESLSFQLYLMLGTIHI